MKLLLIVLLAGMLLMGCSYNQKPVGTDAMNPHGWIPYTYNVKF